jgi:8-oxo-dGTP pyrophosphatase MutT (NUDIX family)
MTAPAAMPPARPAATVVLVRDGDTGLEVLLLERSTVGAFPGMWVFPGGRVDADDAGVDELEQARSAAVREAAEEIGVVLAADQLVTWAHWTPPPVQPKRFLTWFFVAPWPGGEVRVDGHEIVDHVWLTPAAALEHGLPMAPPTHVTLHQLTATASVADLAARGPALGVERFATKHVSHDGGLVLLWHGDAGYETGDAGLPGPRHRAVLDGMRVAAYERT